MRRMLAILLATFAVPATASDDCTEDAMIVFDGSGSMAEMGFNDLDEPRIFKARRALTEVMPELERNRRLGLIVYGPGGKDACSGLDLRFPPLPEAGGRIVGEVNALQPAGDTALTEAMAMAADVLLREAGTGTIVLVTDGKETCGGAPCTLAAELAAETPGLTLHVIGFKVRGDFFDWDGSEYAEAETVSRCLADRTGGLYVSAETVEDLVAALRKTLGCKVLF